MARKAFRTEKRKKNEQLISLKEVRDAREEDRGARKTVAAKRGRRLFAFRRLYLLAFLILLIVSALYAVRIEALNREKERTLSEMEAALEQKERLEAELEHVDDPEYVEQQARARLRMIKPGEVLYVLPKPSEAALSEAGGEAPGDR
jgi:cell division protein FtsB